MRRPSALLLAATAALAAAATAAATLTPVQMRKGLPVIIAHEKAAQAALDATPPNWVKASKELVIAVAQLQAVADSAGAASNADLLDAGERHGIVSAVNAAGSADGLAEEAIRHHNKAKAEAALARAGLAKARLQAILEDVGTAKRCESTKEFDVYAVPQGFAGSYADVYPHGVPKNAQHIAFSFVDTATGKAPAPALFPGQTWTAANKGFLADGRLDIHVDVTGTGFGAQDANKKHWKVVVTYDC